MYEVSWVRAITLEFGSTNLAVSTILATYMGGLALGAGIVRRTADTLADPLTKYGQLELLLGVYALFSPVLFEWVFPVVARTGAHVSEAFLYISVLRFFAGALLLLPPTILMGATLPILSRFYATRKGDGARGGGLLYGMNTIGAFAGTAVVGFLMLPQLGLRLTIVGVGGMNLVLGTIAFVSGRRVESDHTRFTGLFPAKLKVIPRNRPGEGLLNIYVAVALTGFAAMAAEVVLTRVIILVIGGSQYAFSIVLATFLAGLGIGAAIVAVFLKKGREQAVRLFFFLSLGSAFLLTGTAAVFPHLPSLFLTLFYSWEIFKQPGVMFLAQTFIAAMVMLLPTLAMGGLIPVAFRAVLDDDRSTGNRVARVYVWNTIGSILGSVLGGFVFIPVLGIRTSLLVLMAFYCLAGGMAALVLQRPVHQRAGMAVSVGLLAVLLVLTPKWHKPLMTSAVYNYAYRYEHMNTAELESYLNANQKIHYYNDGLTSTVTVVENLKSSVPVLGIAINGKFDGSSYKDMSNQRLLAHMPLLFHQNPRDVCIIGLGTGCTAGSASLYPLDQETVVEIEPAVIQAAAYFRDHNHHVMSNPEVNIKNTDGRLFLELRPDAFDVIISEPSNPWVAGNADLFTVEFFRLAVRSLKENGMFCQWVHLYAMSPENLKTVVRTFREVFPYAFFISTAPRLDVLLLGARKPVKFNLAEILHRMQWDGIRQDLADPRVDIHDIYDLIARFRMGPNELARFAGTGVLHTDDRPIIAYDAPKELYQNTEQANQDAINEFAAGLAPYMNLSHLPPEERVKFFTRLANAYQEYLPNGNEAGVAARIAREIRQANNLTSK